MKESNTCYTYFSITGNFDPDDITKRLGLEPGQTWKIGEPRRHGIGHYTFANWEIGRCTEYRVCVTEQMEETIRPLTDRINLLNEIREKYDASLRLIVVPMIYAGNGENHPCISPSHEVIAFCAATHTHLDMDQYFFSEEDERLDREEIARENEQKAKDLAKRSVGEIIRQSRQQKGLKQDALAALLHVTPQAISRWETGQTAPDINMLIPLAQELGLSVDQLLGGNRREDFERRFHEAIRTSGDDPKTTLLICEEALKAFPNDETFLYRRAVNEYFIGIDPHTPPRAAKLYLNRAVIHFNSLHREYPDDQSYLSFLAQAHGRLGNTEHAKELLAAYEDKKVVENILILDVLKGEERLQKLKERTHWQTLDLYNTLLKYDTPDAIKEAHGLLDAMASADMDSVFRIVLYLSEAGFAAEAGDMQAYEQKMRLVLETALAEDCPDMPMHAPGLVHERLVADANAEQWWLKTGDLLGNILTQPRLAPPCATKRLLVEETLDCRGLLRSDGRRYWLFCSQFICSADDPYRYAIEYDMSEQESDALHDALDASYKRCPSSEYVYFIEIYRSTVERLIADGVKSGVVAYSRAEPSGMLYGYCNCGDKEQYKGLPQLWRDLPTPDGARVFAILELLIPTNFEGCGLEEKLLRNAIEQAKAQGFTHAECFLHELGMKGTEPQDRAPRFERLLAIYRELGFAERADVSSEHGRCYILQKEL